MSDKMGKETATSVALTLLAHNIPQEEIAKTVGKSQAWVSNLKRNLTFANSYTVPPIDFFGCAPSACDSSVYWTRADSVPWTSVGSAHSALVSSVISTIVCGHLVAASMLKNQKERMNLNDDLKRYLQNSINQYNVCELCGVKKEEVEIQVTIRSKKDPKKIIASSVL